MVGFTLGSMSYPIATEEEKRMIMPNLKTSDSVDVFCTENLLCPPVKRSSTFVLSKFYGARYSIFRSLTSFTSLPHWITGGRSLLELILMTLAFVILVSIIQGYNGKTSGSLVQDFAGHHCWYFCCSIVIVVVSIIITIFSSGDIFVNSDISNFAGLTVIFALRNNVLTVLFGISFEKAIFWHQFTAILVIIMTLIHAMIIVKKSGIIIKSIHSHKASGVALLMVLVISSMSILLKKYRFEAFYYLHISMFFMATGLAVVHGANIFAYASLLWAMDMFIRYYLAAHKVQADMAVLPGDVIRVSFKKPFHYSPGQYCFISVPALSYYQYHVSLLYFVAVSIVHDKI